MSSHLEEVVISRVICSEEGDRLSTDELSSRPAGAALLNDLTELPSFKSEPQHRERGVKHFDKVKQSVSKEIV